MEIIRYSELKKTPWKNGGGITREIAQANVDGSVVWRLSMADVSQDGAFSDFKGLTRVLTVIKGEGLTLQNISGDIRADLWSPVRFDGALKIHAVLNAGPLSDLNLMFDPVRCNGTVATLRGQQDAQLAASDTRLHAVHVLTGQVQIGDEPAPGTNDTVLVRSGSPVLRLNQDAVALLITIDLTGQADTSNPVITVQ